MSTFSDSESATASSAESHTSRRENNDESRSRSTWPSNESSEGSTPTLEMNRCPECGARRFVSKLLVYEVTSYDEGGGREFRRQHVRAEFEFTCSECQTTLRTLPADRRDYYDEVAVLEAERRAALQDQLRQLCGQVGQRAWATKRWIGFVIIIVAVVLIWV